MTNRRRSGKGRNSASKKTESPVKYSRKLSKRNKKSETPERPEELNSECSQDEQTEGDIKILDKDKENNTSKDENDQYEFLKNSDEQKSQSKEEESGGSDGSWKVKSENGGGGGIPKLKLCLTRPPEMASPTSTSEQHSSPRRRRRRGNISPAKEDEAGEENVQEECSKRITRNLRARGKVIESVYHTEVSKEDLSVLSKEVEEVIESEKQNEEDIRPVETNTKEITEIKKLNDTDKEAENDIEGQKNEPKIESSLQYQPEVKKESTIEIHLNPEQEEVTNEPEANQLPEQELITKEQTDLNTEQDLNEKSQQNQDQKQESNAKSQQNQDQEQDSNPKPHQEQDSTVQPQSDFVLEQESTLDKHSETEPDTELEIKLTESVVEEKRSSSRDSSEERAKEAALRSRYKNKKKEGSEEGEVVECPKPDINRKFGLLEKKQESSFLSKTSEGEGKENLEELVPAKSGARKRRWGSSTNKTGKKPSVSISTDFLKEIIPEVKPLLLSEVHLSPNEEDEEGQLKDSEENLLIMTPKKTEKEKILQSDESEKDYEDDALESGVDESTQVETVKPPLPPPPPPQIKEKECTVFTRKVSVLPSNERLQKSPSPPRHKPSNILYIVNLVRPFTIPQLRELLARTGSITEDGFWIDKIKSKCYVKYETEEEAKTTRHALHGIRWPVSNPKQLNVDFGTESAMKAAMEGNDITIKRPIPNLFDKQIELKTSDKMREREREKSGEKRDRNEKEKKDRGRHRNDEKKEESSDDKKSRPLVEPLVRDRTVRKVTMPVREWDVGKNEDGFSPPHDSLEFSRHRDGRYDRRLEYDRDKRDDFEDRRRREKDRNRRSLSGEPPRKSKKKNEEEAPAKLLDDLFRKTKATPCIYWLPLTPEQISVKEEMRRKHMAEHEKKVAELRKMQREQSKRTSDKRRRRTKSRSKSKSVKK